MSGTRGDEPVFVKKGRYVYNPNNPVGRALIAISGVIVIVYLYHLFDGSRWSEGEWRDAVHEAAERLEDRPQTLRGHLGYEERIEDAVRATGQGPEHTVVRVEAVDGADRGGADGKGGGSGADAFEVSADDMDTPYCLRLSPPQPEPAATRLVTLKVSVDVEEGPC
ncbi:hypothetical protein [Streptomyces gobitricini]|uniref:Uncharacterized protein n=1 Tax=Streptomyces gobitricini TaxID=68211 RepID=A0ABN3KYI9_9ACTN